MGTGNVVWSDDDEGKVPPAEFAKAETSLLISFFLKVRWGYSLFACDAMTRTAWWVRWIIPVDLF